MILFSATDFAIRSAAERKTLRLVERTSRFGGTYVAICDEKGVIEVHDSMDEAKVRIS